MNEDQELLDRFAETAMGCIERRLGESLDEWAEGCWKRAIAMKQARDRICTTAKPAEDQIPPFPPIEEGAIPEKPAQIAAKRLGIEPFPYSERS